MEEFQRPEFRVATNHRQADRGESMRRRGRVDDDFARMGAQQRFVDYLSYLLPPISPKIATPGIPVADRAERPSNREAARLDFRLIDPSRKHRGSACWRKPSAGLPCAS